MDNMPQEDRISISDRIRSLGRLRYCPVCESHVHRFLPFSVPPRRPRRQAQCPVCGALERHRAVWHYVKERTDLFDGRPKAMLHVAPEPQLSLRFRDIESIDYLSADLEDSNAMVEMDITQIQYEDETFDVIYCSHVLEHVPDDRKAMEELRRVLKRAGWAILLVPIMAKKTFEDPSVTSPEERARVFGQHDHVRRYGPDYKDRLENSGFIVQADRFIVDLPPWHRWRLGVRRNDVIYFCRKK